MVNMVNIISQDQAIAISGMLLYYFSTAAPKHNLAELPEFSSCCHIPRCSPPTNRGRKTSNICRRCPGLCSLAAVQHGFLIKNASHVWSDKWERDETYHNRLFIIFFFLFPFRTATCWHSTSQPITRGGANTGRAAWGARCSRLRECAPPRATPTSLSWAASWTTSTSRSPTVAHRFSWLWVQLFSVWPADTYMQRHVTRTRLTAGSNLALSGICCQWKVEKGRRKGDVFVPLQALSLF